MKMICLMALLGMSGAASAAGIKCEEAKTKPEMAICASEALTELDSRMNASFRKLLRAAGKGADAREMQEAWLLGDVRSPESRVQCEAEGERTEQCLVGLYERRIRLLEGMTRLLLDEKLPGGESLLVRNASQQYDFQIRLLDACKERAADTSCGDGMPGVVNVFLKGANKPVQRIPMNNIFLSFRGDGEPLVNSARMYDYQGVINVGDFNFDGQEDFAIQNGNYGSYGGPSYDVFLHLAKGERFRYSPALSDLILESLGFFGVDSNSKRLNTLAKSGCCYHEATQYKVVNDQPVPVSRWVQDASRDQRYYYDYSEKLVGGKWKRTASSRSRQETYCEEELDAAVNSLGHDVDRYRTARACKPLSWHRKEGVAARIFHALGEGTAPDHHGLDVVLAEMKTGAVIAQYSDLAEYTTARIDSDGLRIDTADWQLSPKLRGFGVAARFSSASGKSSQVRLTLFYAAAKRLVPVLRQFVTDEWDAGFTIRRTLEMAGTSSNGFFDIVVHEAKYPAPPSGATTQSEPLRRDYVLRHDGKRYVVPVELAEGNALQ